MSSATFDLSGLVAAEHGDPATAMPVQIADFWETGSRQRRAVRLSAARSCTPRSEAARREHPATANELAAWLSPKR